MGYYNWETIVGSKSDKELADFFENDYLDFQAKYFAFNEMKKRDFSAEKIEGFKKQLLLTC